LLIHTKQTVPNITGEWLGAWVKG